VPSPLASKLFCSNDYSTNVKPKDLAITKHP
jgi:hypothetical protein